MGLGTSQGFTDTGRWPRVCVWNLQGWLGFIVSFAQVWPRCVPLEFTDFRTVVGALVMEKQSLFASSVLSHENVSGWQGLVTVAMWGWQQVLLAG